MENKKSRIGPLLRKYFIGGLLVWLPIWATYIVIRFIVQIMDGSVALLPEHLQPQHLFGFSIPGIGLVLTIIILFVTGMLVTNFIGSRIVEFSEKLLARIPLIRSIYAAVKQITEALLKPTGSSFRKVIMIEFPRKGVWSIGFQTSDAFVHAPGDETHITVFVPTTPNPTSGFLMIVPETEIVELDMTVEDGLKTIISIGVVNPKKAGFKAATTY